MLLNGGLPLLLVKGRVKMLRKGSLSNNVEVDCSASTPMDSSIVFRSHLQSVLCFTLASYSYNCCVALLQPGKGLSSGELDVVQPLMLCWWFSLTSPPQPRLAALVVKPYMLYWWLWLILSALCTEQQRP